MKVNNSIIVYLCACLLTTGFVYQAEANYQLKVLVKFPFMVERYDSLGNVLLDSLCRKREVTALIYKTGMIDSLSLEKLTNDSGYVIFDFDYWHDGTTVDSSTLERIDISFPNTYKPVKIGAQVSFEPLRFEAMQFRGQTPEEIIIVLPLSIHLIEYWIGQGNYEFDFVVMSDMHIAESKVNGDFGSSGYNDYDDNPNETTDEIQNSENAVNFINYMVAWWHRPIRFVVCTGDITSSSERSEYQRTKKILAGLFDYLPLTLGTNFSIYQYLAIMIPGLMRLGLKCQPVKLQLVITFMNSLTPNTIV